MWLVKEVWPHIVRRHPNARLQLVGRDPSPSVQALSAADVDVTGAVDRVEPYLANAAVAVAPLRMGGGSRLKILEALAHARPVVATKIGAEGLEDLVDQGILLADGSGQFADAVVDLLTDSTEAQRMGRLGQQAVRARYSWDATLRPLLEQLAQ
jgi:glycosyltransferase involved in cell wall biosynthesis